MMLWYHIFTLLRQAFVTFQYDFRFFFIRYVIYTMYSLHFKLL